MNSPHPATKDLGAIVLVLAIVISSAAGARSTSHPIAVIEGVVVSVHDGDTLRIRAQDGRTTKIRVAGIDAPEVCQPYWKASRDRLRALVQNGEKVRAATYKTDTYGREVAHVYVGERDVAVILIQEGLGWHFTRYQQEHTPDLRRALSGAQEQAQRTRRGLWTQGNPEPPWEFRRRTRGVKPIQPCYE